MPTHNQIDLIEFRAADAATLAAARGFYESAFGWSFTDYGEYLDTPDSGVVAGINAVADDHQQQMPLTVLYVTDLEAARDLVAESGGRIIHDIYGFPGGRRFHFADPAGNELAAWSDGAPPS
ncbi:VOC family protein [Microbacterium sp. CFBP9034]|uniref:VOC family protein n=1 Tax=Microbacterium sp. CFBP9034 TaxID=3096540 RepID=UPI002A6A83A8|nr:VOC family protein [Microbacterium sp. CFBP9034]MDY0908338.1 VOC family protein [Microbacterium sp. CFBP9034]